MGHKRGRYMPKKILIAYFSHEGENLVDDEIVDLTGKGNTKIAAGILQEKLGELGFKVNLHRIEPMIPYPFSYQDTNARSRQEYEDGAVPLINAGPNGFEAYDLVFLGYPNWYGTIPGPILAFLRDHDFKGKTIVPFVTHGGQRFLYSLEAIKKEVNGSEMKEGFAIAAPYMASASNVIADWLNKNAELLN